MIYLSGLLGFLFMLTAEAGVGNSSAMPFCSETEQCLMFDLICESDEYEVRHYDSVKWVSTTERSIFMEMAAMKAFKRLYKYIDGGNEKGKKIEMTAPVLIKMVDKKFWQKSEYTMSFLLPAEDQENPPTPTDSNVKFVNKADFHSFKTFKTYLDLCSRISVFGFRSKKDFFVLQLDSINAKYSKGFHFGAGYNSPMTMFKRHNEVWFVAEGEPVCPDEWE
uniref:Heme-binding protein 2-like n=1 Tax=Gouania willdenowi TaxID=441366 RepID=A0A8C5H898_GOUWI